MQWIARLNRAHITIAIVGIFAFASTFAFLQTLDKKITVAQLSRNVSSGEIISESDLQFVDVSYDNLIEKNLVTRKDINKNELVARIDLNTMDLLAKSSTVRRSTRSGLQSLSIGIESDRANGGDIRKKDLVDIWKTGDDSSLIASSISVRDVIQPNKRLGISTAKTMTIVLAVTSQQARDLSSIVGSTDIMVVLSTGSEKKTDAADSSENEIGSLDNQGKFETLTTAGKATNEGD